MSMHMCCTYERCPDTFSVFSNDAPFNLEIVVAITKPVIANPIGFYATVKQVRCLASFNPQLST